MASSSCSYVVVRPSNLTDEEREAIAAHLRYSRALDRMWRRGDVIVDAVWAACRRPAQQGGGRRLAQSFQAIVRALRRLGKYEDLRSSLEGVLCEQLDGVPRFRLEGQAQDVALTHVYFSRHRWRTSECNLEALTLDRVSSPRGGGGAAAAPEHELVAEADNALIICYFKQLLLLLDDLADRVDGPWASWPSSEAASAELQRCRRVVAPLTQQLMRLLELQLADSS